MKKKHRADDDPLDREIDFSNARPNPYFLAYHDRGAVRVLEPDLAKIFPDNASVNAALRTIADAAARTKKISAKTAAAPKTSRKKAGS